ncbi:hypothetical protein AXG93_3817s1140 [Marchantia polymorpha subsp. ruderalis]|uniref:Uncharacterized protein n=1 Tax=Marchantia polymorpha subsp. ruderalis TaxID=1480154 RepID=A0A176W1X8_MARPO|nr:hypothetical protein AXG93_3817s1140 [Marchantia polymorpha subsp. ruderalis]
MLSSSKPIASGTQKLNRVSYNLLTLGRDSLEGCGFDKRENTLLYEEAKQADDHVQKYVFLTPPDGVSRSGQPQ